MQLWSVQVTSWPCVQNRCLFLSHLAWAPLADSWGLRAWVTQTTCALQVFSTLATKREWVTYQHLKWDAVIATPDPVISERDSAAENQEVFQFTGRLGRFLFHVDIRIRLAFGKSEILCCWEEKVKSWRTVKRMVELLKWPCSWEYQGLENISDGNLFGSGNAYKVFILCLFWEVKSLRGGNIGVYRDLKALPWELELPILGESPKLRDHKRHRGDQSRLENSMGVGPWYLCAALGSSS